MWKGSKNVLIVGISGVTCGGKTTTATKLNNILPQSKIFSQDDYFLKEDDPKHTWIPELNHINYDIISSLDMDKMLKDILEFIEVQKLTRMSHITNRDFEFNKLERNNLKNVCDKANESDIIVLIIEGFSIFNYTPLLPLFNLKYYFTLDKDECFRRRITRVYEPPDCPGYFDQCAWPEHLDQLEDVRKNVKDVKYFDGNSEYEIVNEILADLVQYF